MEREVVSYEAVEMCLIKMIQLDEENTEAMLKLAKIKAEQGE